MLSCCQTTPFSAFFEVSSTKTKSIIFRSLQIDVFFFSCILIHRISYSPLVTFDQFSKSVFDSVLNIFLTRLPRQNCKKCAAGGRGRFSACGGWSKSRTSARSASPACTALVEMPCSFFCVGALEGECVREHALLCHNGLKSQLHLWDSCDVFRTPEFDL